MGTVKTEFLVDPAWIAARIDDPSVRLVEIDVSPAAYNAGHVPGAVFWDAYRDLRHPDYLPVGDAALQELVCNAGIDAGTTVVFHGYGAHLGFWLLKNHGHRNVCLMDGSRERWTSAGQGWSRDTPRHARRNYPLAPGNPHRASKADVCAMLGTPGIVVDTRSRAEYDGERFWPSGPTAGAGRAGHIPGAVHVPIELLRTEDGAFRDTHTMQQVLRERGVDPRAALVTYCTIGNRAAQAWFALTHLLGYENVRVYYGSWTEWGMATDTPIEVPATV
ncbi:MAG TPA: rhodanese-like domain-containing protein [Burkholderiaceae bacterium]|nr:rhodanese-like domain-containing protein [Burkholderiaceae bacterium]